MPFEDLGLSGYWDAANNVVQGSPPGGFRTLRDGPVRAPVLYYVIARGSTNLGGINDWEAGDWAVNFGPGWARFAGRNIPSFSAIYTVLNAALGTGVFPQTPGTIYSRLWLNGPGDGTGVLEYSGGVGPPPSPNPPSGTSVYDTLNYTLAVGLFPLSPGGVAPRLWVNGPGDGTGVLEFS